MVVAGRPCATRSTITPTKYALQILTDALRTVGHSLKGTRCKGNLAPSEASYTLISGIKGGLLALKEFQNLCLNNIAVVATDNPMVVFCIKGGDEIGPSLGPLVENSDLVYQKQVTQNPTHPRPAECDSRQAIQARTDHSNRMVPPSRGIQAICSQWQQPQVDLFATRFNNNYISVSPVPDPQAWAVHALSLPWEDLDPYAFPPVAILGKVVGKLQHALVLGPGDLSNQVDLRAPPLKAIADFPLYFFQDRKLQPGTIDGYRPAIANNWEIRPLMSAKMKISLISGIVSTETDPRAEGHPLLEPFPGSTPADKGSL